MTHAHFLRAGRPVVSIRKLVFRSSFLAFAALALSPAAGAQSARPRELFFAAPQAPLARPALDTPITRSRSAAFDASALEDPVERVSVELFDQRFETFRLEHRESRGPGTLTWIGRAESDPLGTATFALSDGALCGSVRVHDQLWRVRAVADGSATIEEIDERRMPPCATSAKQLVTFAAASLVPPSAASAHASSTAGPSAPAPSFATLAPTIDVMVVYTPQARIGQGGTGAMNALIDLAILETNQAYANSHVLQRIRLVHRGELAGYNEVSWAVDLGRLHDPADGWLDYVQGWRTACGADAVVLLEDAAGPNCGVAFLMGTLSPAFAPDAYCVVSRSCATGVYSFGHELGHVMGLAHDRDNSTDKIMRASYSSTLAQGNAASYSPVASRFGRFVAFLSDATNLVPGDNNGFADVFVRDRDNFTTVRANVGPGGVEANGFLLSAPAISQSGALVAFDCTADDLVASDTNGVADVFVRDLVAATTERISVSGAGAQANGASYDPALSSDGRWVAFASDANNLAGGAGGTQVYVRDRVNGTTVLVSANTGGLAGNGASRHPSITDDGRFVAFSSSATDLVPGDLNNHADVFVRDLQAGTTVRASVRTGGIEAGGDSPFTPGISGNGQFVVFASIAPDLVVGDTNNTWDVFVFDRLADSTLRASVGPGGVQGNGPSGWMARPSITEDGHYVAFASRATDLVAGDTNGADDVFVRDLQAGTTTRVSTSAAGEQRAGASGNVDQNTTVSISSGNGDAIVFVSSAMLEIIDSNGQQDAYVFRMSQPDPPGIDTFSYGYRTSDGVYRTIMAYQPGVRLQYFSNPSVSFNNHVLGVADPDPYSAESWRSLNNSGATVASFYSSVFDTACAADGSGTPCPCANESGPDAGCLNSLGLAGRLAAIGTASVTNDSVVLSASGMPDTFALWFQGTLALGGGAGTAFGDGLRCAGGNVRRLATKANVQGASQLPSAGDPPISVSGQLGSASVVTYQVWYRNPAAFCTASTFNLTNGVTIAWSP